MSNEIKPGVQALLVGWVNNKVWRVSVVRQYSGPKDVYPNGVPVSTSGLPDPMNVWWVRGMDGEIPTCNPAGRYTGDFAEVAVHRRYLKIIGDPSLVKDEIEQLEKQK